MHGVLWRAISALELRRVARALGGRRLGLGMDCLGGGLTAGFRCCCLRGMSHSRAFFVFGSGSESGARDGVACCCWRSEIERF